MLKNLTSFALALLATFAVACGSDPAQNITVVLPTITLPDGSEMPSTEFTLDDRCHGGAELLLEKDASFDPASSLPGEHRPLIILNLIPCAEVVTVNRFHLFFQGQGTTTVAYTSNSARIQNIGFQIAKQAGVFNYEYWSIDPSSFGDDRMIGTAFINNGTQVDHYGSLNADGGSIGPIFSLEGGKGARMMVFGDIRHSENEPAGTIDMRVDRFGLEGVDDATAVETLNDNRVGIGIF